MFQAGRVQESGRMKEVLPGCVCIAQTVSLEAVVHTVCKCMFAFMRLTGYVALTPSISSLCSNAMKRTAFHNSSVNVNHCR